jgi:hypothetical protein
VNRSDLFSLIQGALNRGQAVAAARGSRNSDTLIVGVHAYSVTNAYINNFGQQRIVVRNPWGFDGLQLRGVDDGFIDLSLNEFRASMDFGSGIAIA